MRIGRADRPVVAFLVVRWLRVIAPSADNISQLARAKQSADPQVQFSTGAVMATHFWGSQRSGTKGWLVTTLFTKLILWITVINEGWIEA